MSETLVYADWPIAPAAWRAAWDWLEPAVERSGEGTAESDVADMLERDLAQLWLAYRDGVMVAACVTTSHKPTLHFWLCGGHGCDWRRLGVGIMQAAWRDGFHDFTIDGRKGWHRLLPGVRKDCTKDLNLV